MTILAVTVLALCVGSSETLECKQTDGKLLCEATVSHSGVIIVGDKIEAEFTGDYLLSKDTENGKTYRITLVNSDTENGVSKECGMVEREIKAR